jgi:hypothetical protein
MSYFWLPLSYWFPSQEMLRTNPFRFVLNPLRRASHRIRIRLTIGQSPSRRLTRGVVARPRSRSFRRHWTRFCDLAAGRSAALDDASLESLLPPIFENRALRFEKPTKGRFTYYLIYEQNRGGIYARRVVDLRRNSAYHDVLFADPIPDGIRISDIVIASAVDFYDRLGVNEIRIVAGLSHGGLLWPKFGFHPVNTQEWKSCGATILANLAKLDEDKQQAWRASVEYLVALDDPKAIWDISELPDWIVEERTPRKLGDVLLRGTRWKGILSLNDMSAKARLDRRLDR